MKLPTLTSAEIARAIRAADQAEVEHYTRKYDRMKAVMG